MPPPWPLSVGLGFRGPLAQLVEQKTFNLLVAGSMPERPTIRTGLHRVAFRRKPLKCNRFTDDRTRPLALMGHCRRSLRNASNCIFLHSRLHQNYTRALSSEFASCAEEVDVLRLPVRQSGSHRVDPVERQFQIFAARSEEH